MSDLDRDKRSGGESLTDDHNEADDITISDIRYNEEAGDDRNISGAIRTEDDPGLEFISEETVKDKSKMADGEQITGELVSEKKTRRRGSDETDAKRERIIETAKRNKVILAAVIALIIIIIIAAAAGVRRSKAKKEQENLEQPISEQEYETDHYENINELIEDYYACYAEGDTESILLYATPMSELEMSYIQMYSEYLEGMENIVCYTKTGVSDGEYVVSVTAEWKYKGVESTAPGLDFFYVTVDEDGEASINNVYSTFNMVYQENEMDDEVLELIESYQLGDDVIALQASVQTLYDSALEEDEALSTLLTETIPAAITAWQESGGDTTDEDSEDASDESDDSSEEDAEADDAGSDGDGDTEEEAAEDEVTETEDKAWVTATDGVYIRESPSTDSEALASINAGDEVRRLAVTSNGWSKVKSGDIVGYVRSEYLEE